MDSDIPSPELRLDRNALRLLTLCGVIGTFAAFIFIDASSVVRVLISAGVVVALFVTFMAAFALRWLVAQAKRAFAYPKLQEALRSEQASMARLALGLGVAPLEVDGYTLAGSNVRMILGTGSASQLRPDDKLVILDTLEHGLLARARVESVNAERCEALVTSFESSVFEGFMRDRLKRFDRSAPPSTSVLADQAIRARVAELEIPVVADKKGAGK